MFRFEYSEYLYAVILIPVLIAVFVLMWYARRRALERFGNHVLVQQLMPNVSPYKHIIKFTMLMIAFLLLVIGWANPQWGTKKEKVKIESSDVMIALDVSNSMLAQDIQPNRNERSRKFTLELIEGLKGERVGLIVFAGNAYLQMPLTSDYTMAEVLVKSAKPEMIPLQGTSITDAINLAERSFGEDGKHHKALIIITDGENHEEGMMATAEAASDNGLLIFTVGVGTEKQSPIPIYSGGRSYFKKDQNGQTVYTKLNEQMLKDVAKAGRGQYYNITAGSKIIDAIKDRIDKVGKREVEQRSFSDYESYFQIFLLIALILIVAEFLLSYRKSELLKGKDLFGE